MTNFIKQKTKTLVMHKAVNYTLIAFILAAAISYIYLANITVRTLTILEKTKQHMQSLSIEVSEMESERLSVENDINAEKIQQLGFVEVKHPLFIVKNSKKAVLSFKVN